jgi:hypothetical protein
MCHCGHQAGIRLKIMVGVDLYGIHGMECICREWYGFFSLS